MKCCAGKFMKFFKAVHDKHRHNILHIVKKEGEINASEIIKKIKLSQPTVSHHLKILCEADVLMAKKKGKEVFYSINEKHFKHCCEDIMDCFCK